VERRVEGGAAGRQNAIGGRQWPWGHVCRWEVYLCMEMVFSIQVVLTVPGPRDPGDGKIKKASAELQ